MALHLINLAKKAPVKTPKKFKLYTVISDLTELILHETT